MERVSLLVELSIKDGRAAEFRSVVARFRDLVQQREPATLAYDWWIDGSERRALVIETFQDSDALATHMADTAPLVPELTATADIVRVDVLGDPRGDGRDAVEAAATDWFSHLGGLAGHRRSAV